MESLREELRRAMPGSILKEAELRWGDDNHIRQHRDKAAERMVRLPLLYLGAAALETVNKFMVDDSHTVMNAVLAYSVVALGMAGNLNWIGASEEARKAHDHEQSGQCERIASLTEPQLPPSPPQEPA